MNILVYLKQIPADNANKDYQDTDCLNDSDKNVLEEALNLREQLGGSVTVMVMGPPAGEKVLQEALTYGIERAILVSDREFNDMDISGAAGILAEAIRKTGPYDLIFCGRQAIDGDAAHMAVMTAQNLALPLIPYSKEIQIHNKEIHAICAGDQIDSRVKALIPAVILSIREQNQKRYPKVSDIIKAYDSTCKIEILDALLLDIQVPKKKMQQIAKYTPNMVRTRHLSMLESGSDREKGIHILKILQSMNYL